MGSLEYLALLLVFLLPALTGGASAAIYVENATVFNLSLNTTPVGLNDSINSVQLRIFTEHVDSMIGLNLNITPVGLNNSLNVVRPRIFTEHIDSLRGLRLNTTPVGLNNSLNVVRPRIFTEHLDTLFKNNLSSTPNALNTSLIQVRPRIFTEHVDSLRLSRLNVTPSGLDNSIMLVKPRIFLESADMLLLKALTNLTPDITPPDSVANLHETEAGPTWINWTWKNPANPDFSHVMLYLDGAWKANTSLEYYNATGLLPETIHRIGTRIVDTSGNISQSWLNDTAITLSLSEQIFTDDFTSDSGMWSYVGSTYRDSTNGYVVLTKNVNYQVGIAWFNASVKSNFTVEFRYKAGGGSGADGLVLMFYKKKNYNPAAGGNLGFVESGSVPGYGVEFDNYYNSEFSDPSSRYIALLKDHVNNHLIYVNDDRTEDFIWHNVKITVNETELIVDLDGEKLFSWYGTFNKTYCGFGFSGATGGANNWHLIDDVKIKYENNVVDTTPPAGITNLHEESVGTSWINWTWINPTDSDFSHVMINLDGVWKANVTAPQNYFNATSLSQNTVHEIAIRTADIWDNVNGTWVNDTATTFPEEFLPVPIIVSPLAGSIINGTVVINATTNSTGIVSASFEYTDGLSRTLIVNDTDGSDGWTALWDTTKVPDGVYTLRVVMLDVNRSRGEDSIAVTVFNHPAVRLTALPSRKTVENINASHSIGIFNSQYNEDTFDLTVSNPDNAAVAALSQSSITIPPWESREITLNVTDETPGEYTDTVSATSRRNTNITGSIAVKTIVMESFNISLAALDGTRTSIGANITYSLTLKNNQMRSDSFTLTTSGVNRSWISLDSSHLLSSGEEKTIPVVISIPITANAGSFKLNISATSSNTKTKRSASAPLIIQSGPIITGLVPENGARLGSNSVIFTWITNLNSSTKVLLNQSGTVTTYTGSDGIYHSIVVDNLSRNIWYTYRAVSNTSRGSTESETRSFYIDNGISFTQQTYNFTIERNYDQRATITVKNTDNKAHDLLLTVNSASSDLIVGFVGNGSQDKRITLAPSEAKDVTLAMHAQDAAQESYYLLLNLTADANLTDHAVANVRVRQPNIDLRLEEISTDPLTLAKTLQVTNYGDAVTDLNIYASSELKDNVTFQPTITHGNLPSGVRVNFNVVPVLSLDFTGINGTIVAETAGKKTYLTVNYTLPMEKRVYMGYVGLNQSQIESQIIVPQPQMQSSSGKISDALLTNSDTLAIVAEEPIYNTPFLTDIELEDYTSLTADQIRTFLKNYNSYFQQPIQDADDQTFDPPAVIVQAASQYRINPKVILATLEKESSGVTRTTRPSDTAMRFLMGCVSPSTARQQLTCAAERFRVYHDQLTNTGSTVSGWRVGAPKTTQDGVTVTPATKAVAGQFTYTPYAGVQWGGNQPSVGGVYLFYYAWNKFGFKTERTETFGIPTSEKVSQPFLNYEPSYNNKGKPYYDENNVLIKESPEAFHRGVDIIGYRSIDDTNPVYASGSGIVAYIDDDGQTKNYGNYVVIYHGYNINGNGKYTYSFYSHMGNRYNDDNFIDSNIGTAQYGSKNKVGRMIPNGVFNRVGRQGHSGFMLNDPVIHLDWEIRLYDKKLKHPWTSNYRYDGIPASPNFYIDTGIDLTSTNRNDKTSYTQTVTATPPTGKPQEKTIVQFFNPDGYPDTFNSNLYPEIYWLQNNILYEITEDTLNKMAPPESPEKHVIGWGWDETNIFPVSVLNDATYYKGPIFIKPDKNGESDGILIRQINDYKIYLIEKGNRSWLNIAPDTFLCCGFSFEDVIDVSPEIMKYIPESTTAISREDIMNNWYCTNRPTVRSKFTLPSTIKRSLSPTPNIENGYLVMRFTLPWSRDSYRPHNVNVYLNDIQIGRLNNTIPEGHYVFRFDPSILNYADSGTATNTVTIKTENLNGGHYVVATDMQVILPMKRAEMYVVASNQSEADEIIKDMSGVMRNRADLGIYPEDIKFSNPRPNAGEDVTINATIFNLGTVGAPRIEIQFLDNGVQIGENLTLGFISSLDSVPVNITWKPAAGVHTISIRVNSEMQIQEYDYSNNEASKLITVGGATDTTPPQSIINPSLQATGPTWLNFTWTNPPDPDYHHVMLYLNGNLITNVTAPKNFYNFTGLSLDTSYELGTHTVDTAGNINLTWVNLTARTAPSDTGQPASIRNLTNASYAPNYINWTWTDPSDATFAYVSVWIDNDFKTNVSKGRRFYNATGFNPDSLHTISTRTVNISGRVNLTWVNHTARTAPDPASVTNLSNVSYAPNYIKWTWTDPVDSNFSKIMLYFDGKFKKNVSRGVKYYNATSLLANTLHTIATRTVDTNGKINNIWVNHTARTAPDVTPPASATNLTNASYAPNYINWTWTDPKDPDFKRVMIYLDGKFKTNVSKGKKYYNTTGLLANTTHTISTRTVDTNGNINQTWINHTARTAPDFVPPAGVTNLTNASYAANYVKWTWTDPNDSDFARVIVYIDGKFKANVSKGVRYYNATGLIALTQHTISTRTIDTSGNINLTWANNTAWTARDFIPPAGVTRLKNTTYAQTYINWTWTDPLDPDLANVMVYLDGIFKTSVPRGMKYYTIGNLVAGTQYTIGTRTIDTSGNINMTWVNHTARTRP